MNASPANLSPASSVQPQSASGKPQDSESDTPFSQVLSSEIAQSQRGGESEKAEKADAKPDTKADDTTEAVDPATAGTIQASMTDTVQIAATFDMLRADAMPASPENFLALAIPTNQTGQAPTDSLQLDEVPSEKAAVQIGNLQIGPNSRKGQAQTLQVAQPGNAAADSQKPDVGKAAKANDEFIGQLASARQADSTKTAGAAGTLADQMTPSILRTTPQAGVEAPTPTSGAAANRLAPSVGTAAWGQALGEKVIWMATGAQQTASLTLNPPNLGPLQIVLNVSNDQATASFFSAQPEVRQALESAFPRLREMMNEAGIQLGQATVSAETPQQQAFEQQPHRASIPFPGVNEPVAAGLSDLQMPAQRTGRGLVDTFA